MAKGSAKKVVNTGPSEAPEEELRRSSRRRGRDGDEPSVEQQATKKRRGRVLPGGGNTSTGPPPEPVEPMSPIDGIEARTRDNDRLMEAVIKVFCVHSEPNFSLPWQRKRQYSSTSSGFIISGNRILTNAHSVDHHTQVKVKRRGSDVKFVAQVLAVGTECDIAMLTVEDSAFWEDVEHVHFGTLPRLQDSVTVIGYPIGGDTMSVTSGVVSRIEVTSYVHGAAELLGIQIDAAINSGNSGGPAFNDRGECVGIAFQSLRNEDAENIGYVISPNVIDHFISDYERNGRFSGFPCLGVEWQKMESAALRQALGMKPNQKGVRVRRVEPTSPAAAVLSSGDILMSFDGVEVANDGTVPFRSGERIGFSYLVSNKYTGDEAKLMIMSGGKAKQVSVKLAAPVRLIPVHINNAPPSYFIVAGLVFTAVTVPFLRSEYGKEFEYDSPVKLLDAMMHAMADNAEQQVVVLSQVLAADANIGYEEIVNTQVRELNGKKVNNLRDLVMAVESCADKYLRLDLEYNQVVILDTESAKKSTAQILEMHCIPSDRSADLRDTAPASATGKPPPAASAAAGSK